MIDKITGKLSEQKPNLTFTGHIMFSQSLCFVLLGRICSVSEYVNRLLMVQIYNFNLERTNIEGYLVYDL